MALGLTPEHLELAATVRGWAQRHCPADVVRAAVEADDSGAQHYRASLAPSLAGQGLLGLHLPEEAGGQGFGLPELAVALEETGRAMLPGAYLATVLASAVLAEALDVLPVLGQQLAKLLAKLADGSLAGTVSLGAGLAAQPRPDGGLTVTGETGPVMAGPLADLVIAAVSTDDGEAWVLLDAADLEVTALDAVDLTRPLANLRADDVLVSADRIMSGLDRTAVMSLTAILFGAEACGIADWSVQTAADYAKIRHQFGRPIGQFQAVKHRCARMLTGAEQAAAAVWDAARTPPGRDREFASAVTAVIALDAAVDAANDCIQTLGGIGYTWEHHAHLYYRRALSLRALLGPSLEWRERVAAMATDGAMRAPRVELPDGDAEFRAAVRTELAEIRKVTGSERTARLAAGGWVLPHLPKPWGRDAKPLEQLVIDEEMRAAGVRAHNLAIGAWVVPALIQYGTSEQQQRFLPSTLRMDYLWCQLFSEPGAGSDLAGLQTGAERVEGGWRITGQKIWTSLAKQAAWGICIARTDPSAPRHDGISYFLVDMGSAGIDVRPLREITGDASFNQVFLDNVFVPDDCLVGEVNGGWRIARTTLANERVSLSQTWTFGSGVSELLDVTRAAEHPPLGDVGRLVCEGRSIDLLGLRVTLKRISGTEPGATGSVRKLLGMRNAQQIADLCFAMSGTSAAVGSGFGSPVTRDGKPNGAHWARQDLAVRAVTIGGGTTDIQLNIVAERMLGLPRDPEPPSR
ncbi:MAG TPA: acyl-CoA dehydrogenase [Streptosporangiaceae bacterium]|jgi:alkylation response protein AidB-like acyl-CoA dehydrogenase|nr:acyl-CoA dehydrogenase [Streptosporangiaceae bacterium]